MPKAKTNLSALTRSDVQDLLKQIDLTGVEFSAIMGKSKNFVTDMKRFGVPFYVEIILRLAVELKTNGGDPKSFLKQFDKSSVST
ncbi:hypothetical protein E0765_07495 [Sulfuricurvum sp. IAE1]|uniref:hypothetical protein n=1 Tax=Sulfuricurvum sp. IAE1 TaxID=2546102 RepID=UPI00104C5279|nr:hypothetical protein [Sulfuricurvum sp. IAE1]TDA63671.1 hypothetical protein E0765_07495 [Sulfuricurvum sp. IAE1]